MASNSLGRKMAGLIVFTLFWCGITGAFCYIVVGSMVKSNYAKLHYGRTEGTVLLSEVESHPDSDGTTYSPHVRYTYQVDGVQYTADRYDFMGGSSGDSSYAHRVVAENLLKSKVTVYYDPDRPAQAVLRLDVPNMSYFMLLFLQPFILIGLSMIVYCFAMPFRYLRLERFLQSPCAMPWTIPGWGTLEEGIEGQEIVSRPGLLGPLGHFLIGYGLASFFGIFIVAFLFHGIGDGNPAVIRVAFAVALVVGLLAMARKAIAGAGSSRLIIDRVNHKLLVRSRRREMEIPLAKITGLRLRPVLYPAGMSINNQRKHYLLLEATSNGPDAVPLHAFSPQSWAGRSDEVAAKVQRDLGELLGVKPPEDVATPDRQQVSPPTNPIEALRLLKSIAGQWRKGENYDDLT